MYINIIKTKDICSFMGIKKSENHPLEGKYIIYNYGIQDYEDEGWALALFQLKNGYMNEVYHPGNHVLQQGAIGEQQTEELLELMKKRKIKKVYSVFSLDNFFGIPSTWISLHEPNEKVEEIELWAEWKSIEKESYEHRILKEEGIEVIFYEEPKKQV
jgi:hypothetical protein